ncbi:hypothetical protein DFW101_1489 [Solidesulfovibrio carbinoliphilus subsp. oakridgensis]|uniref:Uncharacterized protein n=1 Tax=Solidesulfovibrio carbinoliphilus subsp. oakridgensis TaxID=694327 RepID=G7Q4N7_9BACT|nr:hypothetical protein [Solidesulfovibrio carbinoliphilus]EHJ47497.1 hypothetical protein DFW101_1489 [Solidesulfovibrio carbinoliphilus subsp. oakridgensis]
MKKFRVYFATKVNVTTSWFRRKKDVSETEYVVVSAHNEAHAVKEAKKHVDLDALGMPFQVTRITSAADDEAEGCHGTLARRLSPAEEPAAVPDEPQA